MRNFIASGYFLLMVIFCCPAMAQISPGPLATVHANLEGLTNCTQCHVLGNKVINARCLECHSELKSRIDQNKGYHSSSEIKGKNCVACHSDHHGSNFQIIRFSKENFNHDLTGYTLSGAHSKKNCKDCHKPEFIASKNIKSKKFTYLGLNTECLGCHADYHQKTLSSACSGCHGLDSFKPATKFNHGMTKYPLIGMHQTVPCLKCHNVTTKNGVRFQEFAGIQFQGCISCHADVHQNKFGQNCTQCHSEESFHSVKGIANFDHSKTKFILEDKHQNVACKLCHKASLTNPIKYDRCTDCHSDYHHQQFTLQGITRDCSECHSTKGFTGTSYTIEQHSNSKFQLKGAHVATPCLTCHKKQEKWSFREIGMQCSDCHENIHQSFINSKYYPGNSCESCHNESRWGEIKFDHSSTAFQLTGAHSKQSCRTCHFKTDSTGRQIQVFARLGPACTTCHPDTHYKQFETNGMTDCLRCHSIEFWRIANFDHNKTAFKLDGKHQNVACSGCHKNKTEGNHTFVFYKIREWRCENCH